jgi:ribokinase
MRGVDLSAVFAFTPNETEARTCLGLAPDDPAKDDELAAALLDLGPHHVILTRGGRGVLWASKQGLVEVPALKVTPVDTVGAGDAFCAGLAVGLGEGMGVAEAIAMGVTAASLSTLKRETLASYPSRAEVDERIGEVLDLKSDSL